MFDAVDHPEVLNFFALRQHEPKPGRREWLFFQVFRQGQHHGCSTGMVSFPDVFINVY
jgi:hypothetical protein